MFKYEYPSCDKCGGTYGHRLTCPVRQTQAAEQPMGATLQLLLAQTTTRADTMQAALWKLEKMSWLERLWHGRDVVREALRIGEYKR